MGRHYFSHLTNTQAESQGGYIICPRSHSEEGEMGLELSSVWFQAHVLSHWTGQIFLLWFFFGPCKDAFFNCISASWACRGRVVAPSPPHAHVLLPWAEPAKPAQWALCSSGPCPCSCSCASISDTFYTCSEVKGSFFSQQGFVLLCFPHR